MSPAHVVAVVVDLLIALLSLLSVSLPTGVRSTTTRRHPALSLYPLVLLGACFGASGITRLVSSLTFASRVIRLCGRCTVELMALWLLKPSVATTSPPMWMSTSSSFLPHMAGGSSTPNFSNNGGGGHGSSSDFPGRPRAISRRMLAVLFNTIVGFIALGTLFDFLSILPLVAPSLDMSAIPPLLGPLLECLSAIFTFIAVFSSFSSFSFSFSPSRSSAASPAIARGANTLLAVQTLAFAYYLYVSIVRGIQGTKTKTLDLPDHAEITADVLLGLWIGVFVVMMRFLRTNENYSLPTLTAPLSLSLSSANLPHLPHHGPGASSSESVVTQTIRHQDETFIIGRPTSHFSTLNRDKRDQGKEGDAKTRNLAAESKESHATTLSSSASAKYTYAGKHHSHDKALEYGASASAPSISLTVASVPSTSGASSTSRFIQPLVLPPPLPVPSPSLLASSLTPGVGGGSLSLPRQTRAGSKKVKIAPSSFSTPSTPTPPSQSGNASRFGYEGVRSSSASPLPMQARSPLVKMDAFMNDDFVLHLDGAFDMQRGEGEESSSSHEREGRTGIDLERGLSQPEREGGSPLGRTSTVVTPTPTAPEVDAAGSTGMKYFKSTLTTFRSRLGWGGARLRPASPIFGSGPLSPSPSPAPKSAPLDDSGLTAMAGGREQKKRTGTGPGLLGLSNSSDSPAPASTPRPRPASDALRMLSPASRASASLFVTGDTHHHRRPAPDAGGGYYYAGDHRRASDVGGKGRGGIGGRGTASSMFVSPSMPDRRAYATASGSDLGAGNSASAPSTPSYDANTARSREYSSATQRGRKAPPPNSTSTSPIQGHMSFLSTMPSPSLSPAISTTTLPATTANSNTPPPRPANPTPNATSNATSNLSPSPASASSSAVSSPSSAASSAPTQIIPLDRQRTVIPLSPSDDFLVALRGDPFASVPSTPLMSTHPHPSPSPVADVFGQTYVSSGREEKESEKGFAPSWEVSSPEMSSSCELASDTFHYAKTHTRAHALGTAGAGEKAGEKANAKVGLGLAFDVEKELPVPVPVGNERDEDVFVSDSGPSSVPPPVPAKNPQPQAVVSLAASIAAIQAQADTAAGTEKRRSSAARHVRRALSDPLGNSPSKASASAHSHSRTGSHSQTQQQQHLRRAPSLSARPVDEKLLETLILSSLQIIPPSSSVASPTIAPSSSMATPTTATSVPMTTTTSYSSYSGSASGSGSGSGSATPTPSAQSHSSPHPVFGAQNTRSRNRNRTSLQSQSRSRRTSTALSMHLNHRHPDSPLISPSETPLSEVFGAGASSVNPRRRSSWSFTSKSVVAQSGVTTGLNGLSLSPALGFGFGRDRVSVVGGSTPRHSVDLSVGAGSRSVAAGVSKRRSYVRASRSFPVLATSGSREEGGARDGQDGGKRVPASGGRVEEKPATPPRPSTATRIISGTATPTASPSRSRSPPAVSSSQLPSSASPAGKRARPSLVLNIDTTRSAYRSSQVPHQQQQPSPLTPAISPVQRSDASSVLSFAATFGKPSDDPVSPTSSFLPAMNSPSTESTESMGNLIYNGRFSNAHRQGGWEDETIKFSPVFGLGLGLPGASDPGRRSLDVPLVPSSASMMSTNQSIYYSAQATPTTPFSMMHTPSSTSTVTSDAYSPFLDTPPSLFNSRALAPENITATNTNTATSTGLPATIPEEEAHGDDAVIASPSGDDNALADGASKSPSIMSMGSPMMMPSPQQPNKSRLSLFRAKSRASSRMSMTPQLQQAIANTAPPNLKRLGTSHSYASHSSDAAFELQEFGVRSPDGEDRSIRHGSTLGLGRSSTYGDRATAANRTLDFDFRFEDLGLNFDGDT